jgi:plasmid stabilization system protein ParE
MVEIQNYTIVWDKSALNELIEILNYLAKQSAEAPSIVKKAIMDRLKVIKSNPLISEQDKLRIPPSKNFRAFVIFSYRISYQIHAETNEVRILRIRHTSREPLGY